ncbi:alpha/beta hydrolase [Plantactinospora sp. WMMB782]|uniref:alpha/beta hydrolase n=1 Tax=Plantactinospora sp. WMMB782 TaxID=3404121 RepID=UPI003B93A33A
MQITGTEITFRSAGVTCAGRLYRRPDGPTPMPGVVLVHGVSGVMDRLDVQAAGLASYGMAALVFDYRGFGRSAGEPRQVLDLPAQRADLRAAVDWLRAHDDVDPGRVALWGNSLGGAYAISEAADDPAIAAVVSQIPFNGFPRRVEGRSTGDSLRLLGAILEDVLRGRLGRRPAYIPMIGRPGQVAVVATGDARRHLRTLTGQADIGDAGQRVGTWRNEIAPRGLLQMMRYRPEEDAARLRVPLLVCVAADDREAPPEAGVRLAERAPYGQVLRYPGRHFDFYADPDTQRRVAADQGMFLRTQLASKSDAG